MHDAFDTLEELRTSVAHNRASDPFIISYKRSTGRAHVLLKEGIRIEDVLKAAFLSHVMLHFLDKRDKELGVFRIRHGLLPGGQLALTMPGARKHGSEMEPDLSERSEEALQYSTNKGEALYREFLNQCRAKGWRIENSMLNPKDNRIRTVML